MNLPIAKVFAKQKVSPTEVNFAEALEINIVGMKCLNFYDYRPSSC